MDQNFEIKPVHDILYVDMNGTWSPDETLEYVQDFKKKVSRYFACEWACVLNLQNLDMLLSEEFQIETLRALDCWSYIKGMKSVAVIIGSNNRSHLLYQFEEIYKGTPPYATAVCHSEIEANNWLSGQGFSAKLLLRSQKSA